MLWPCSPPGSPHPQIRSSIWSRSSSGTFSSTLVTTWAARSSGLTSTREPLRARPIGERPNATITASVISELWPQPCGRCLFGAAIAEQDECPQAREGGGDDRHGDCGVEFSPAGHKQDEEETWQPQRSRQLAPAERPVALAFQDQLSRQALVRVQWSKDRVHAAPLQAAEISLLGHMPGHFPSCL